MLDKSLKSKIDEHLFVHYGLEGNLERLGGENINVLVTTRRGDRFVLKILTGGSPEDAARMEDRLFGHVQAAGFELGLPVIKKNYKGNLYSGIKIRCNEIRSCYLTDYVEGKTLENHPDISDSLVQDAGRALACLDQALVGFDDPSTRLTHQWELPQAGRHRDKMAFVEDPVDRELVAWAIALWDSVAERLDALPWQVIHGDANKENILASGDRISGLVDFADACYNPRICELAILLAYLMTEREDPMAAARVAIEGYTRVIELEDRELDVLFPLVCGRLAVTVCMASARLKEAPGNANWFVSLEPALRLLRQLQEITFRDP